MQLWSRGFVILFVILLSSPVRSQLQWQVTPGIEGIASSKVYSDGAVAYFCGLYHVYRTTNATEWEPIHDDIFSHFAFRNDTLVGLIKNYFSDDAPADSISISVDGGDNWTILPLPDGINSSDDFIFTEKGLFLQNYAGSGSMPGFTSIWRLNFDTQNWEKFEIYGHIAYPMFEGEGDIYYINYNSQSSITRKELFRYKSNLYSEYLHIYFDEFAYVSDLFTFQNFLSVRSHHTFPTDKDGIYQSFDSGHSWKKASEDSLYFLPKGVLNGVIYGLGIDKMLYQSVDTGRTWSLLSYGDTSTQLKFKTYHRFGFIGGYILSGNHSGVFLGINPQDSVVVHANHGINEARVTNLDNTSGFFFAAASNGIFSYDPELERWARYVDFDSIIGSGYFSNIQTSGSGLVLATGSSWSLDSFLLSRDYGLSWSVLVLPWADSISLPVAKIVLLDDVIYLTTVNTQLTYQSSDYGLTWHLFQLENANINSWPIKWKGDQMAYNDHAIYTSKDSGSTWQLYAEFTTGILDRIMPSENFLVALARDDSGLGDHVYYSDNGYDWHYGHDGLPDIYVIYQSAWVNSKLFEHKGMFFMCTDDQGFYGTPDTFDTWYPVELMYPDFFNEWVIRDDTFYNSYIGVRKAAVPALHKSIISGTVFYDINGSNTMDPDDAPMPYINLNLIDRTESPPVQVVRSNLNGVYKFTSTVPLNDTVRCKYMSPYLKSITPEYYLINDGSYNNDFAIQLYEDKTDLSIYGSSGVFRPGFDTRISLTYRNEGTTQPQSLLCLKLDSNITYLTGTPTPTVILEDSLIWDLGVLGLMETGSVDILTRVKSDVPQESQVTITGSMLTSSSDETPLNNIIIINGHVSNTILPNSKIIDPEKGLTRNSVKNGAEVYYTVRFQNNTAHPVNRIKILDAIDTTLIVNSIRYVSSSHEPTRFRVLPTGRSVLEIVFDDIVLPDSITDYAASQGYVTFAVKRKAHVQNHIPTRNTALIRFDSSPPTTTNKTIWWPRYDIVTSTLDVNTAPSPLLIYPNPANDFVSISSGDGFCSSGMLLIRNLGGALVATHNTESVKGNIVVDIKELASGVYSLELRCGVHSRTGMLIIQR
ncbi:MAG: hypothetical protein DRI69_11705 [Bacteroidetes bacterium]|nr:MAG: hypothetical protein DRI69_11705 [Bacteroidota bacterium]